METHSTSPDPTNYSSATFSTIQRRSRAVLSRLLASCLPEYAVCSFAVACLSMSVPIIGISFGPFELGSAAKVALYPIIAPFLFFADLTSRLLGPLETPIVSGSRRYEFESMLRIAIVVPVMTWTWLCALPTLVLSIIATRHRPMLTGHGTSLHSEPVCTTANVPWRLLIPCAVINGGVLGAYAGFFPFYVYLSNGDFFIWDLAIPHFLFVGLPYAFAPLILMAARRMIACIRED